MNKSCGESSGHSPTLEKYGELGASPDRLRVMYDDVFRDDSWILSEDCLDSDENKKRKSNPSRDNEDFQAGNITYFLTHMRLVHFLFIRRPVK